MQSPYRTHADCICGLLRAQKLHCIGPAGADHSALLMSQALPPLLTAATAIEEQSGQWQGALPLAALTALCTSSSHLRQPILHSMQQLLPALLAAAVGSNQHEQMLLGVLHMLRGQLQASAVPDSMLASDVARHLLTGVLQLSKVRRLMLLTPSEHAEVLLT